MPVRVPALLLRLVMLHQARHDIAVAVTANRDAPVLLGPKVRFMSMLDLLQ